MASSTFGSIRRRMSVKHSRTASASSTLSAASTSSSNSSSSSSSNMSLQVPTTPPPLPALPPLPIDTPQHTPSPKSRAHFTVTWGDHSPKSEVDVTLHPSTPPPPTPPPKRSNTISGAAHGGSVRGKKISAPITFTNGTEPAWLSHPSSPPPPPPTAPAPPPAAAAATGVVRPSHSIAPWRVELLVLARSYRKLAAAEGRVDQLDRVLETIADKDVNERRALAALRSYLDDVHLMCSIHHRPPPPLRGAATATDSPLPAVPVAVQVGFAM